MAGVGFTLKKRVKNGWQILYPATIPSQILGLDAYIRNLVGNQASNKGYFPSKESLEAAFPEAEAGDYATVNYNSSYVVFVWDVDKKEWKNTGVSGSVNSVNGKTGDITLAAISETGSIDDLKTSKGQKANISQVVLSSTDPGTLRGGDFWLQTY